MFACVYFVFALYHFVDKQYHVCRYIITYCNLLRALLVDLVSLFLSNMTGVSIKSDIRSIVKCMKKMKTGHV